MEHPNPERKWKNMRRMAWVSLVAALVFPVGVYFGGDKLIDIASAYYLFLGAVVGAYMGFSAYGDKR